MVSLETILLGNNQVDGVDPSGLLKLRTLSTLDLSNNDVLKVPPELGLCTSLRCGASVGGASQDLHLCPTLAEGLSSCPTGVSVWKGILSVLLGQRSLPKEPRRFWSTCAAASLPDAAPQLLHSLAAPPSLHKDSSSLTPVSLSFLFWRMAAAPPGQTLNLWRS